MIIDSHTYLEDNGKPFSPQQLIASMDEAGIDISLVFPEYSKLRKVSLENLIKICKNFPRLKIVGGVDYFRLNEKQIEIFRKLLSQKIVVGLKLYSGYESFSADDKKLFPLFKFCSDNNFAVVFHTGLSEEGFSGKFNPKAIIPLAKQLPNLKIILAHFGRPFIKDCARIMRKYPNVYADLSGYFIENQAITKEQTEKFIKVMAKFKILLGNLKKFIFATDWPLYSQKEYLEAVRLLNLTKEEKDLVFFQNANRLFNLGLTNV